MIWLELIGLALAGLDFFGQIHRIEALLDRVRRGFLRLADESWRSIADLNKRFEKDGVEQRNMWRDFLTGAIRVFVVLVLLVLFHAAVTVVFGADYYFKQTVALFLFAVLAAVAFAMIPLSIAVSLLALMIAAMVAHWMFALMDRAPSGSVGSLGLILALAGLAPRIL